MKSETLVRPTKHFQKEFKRLKRKFPSLKQDVAELNKELLANPTMGVSLGNNTYKIRLAIKSKGKGKSGGARVVSYVETELIGIIQNNVVSLLTIYDKSDVNSISKEQISFLIKNMEFE